MVMGQALHVTRCFFASPDQSVNPVLQYLQRFRLLKPDPSLIEVSAVGPDGSSSCDSVMYTGIKDAVVDTDGFLISSCDRSWSSILPELASSLSPDLRTFTLSQSAAVNSLEVILDGEIVTEFILEGNTVRFITAPVPGSQLQFSYLPLGCE